MKNVNIQPHFLCAIESYMYMYTHANKVIWNDNV